MWPFFTAIGIALLGMWAQQRKDAKAIMEAGKMRDYKLDQISINVDGNLTKALEKIDRLESVLEKSVAAGGIKRTKKH
jgi:hypothetical protein